MSSIVTVRAAVAVGCIACLYAGSSRAQNAATADQGPSTTPSQQAAGQGSQELEEVVVTANRREQNMQAVPIAVEAISPETAAAVGVIDMQSLASAVPGLLADRSAGTAIPFLRGVGSPVGQASAEPSVAVYVDNVYTPAAGADLDNFNSISSIEVEKGPQGTLFGRNATGGVIQVFTRNPVATPELDVNAGWANYDTPSASMYATDAVADHLAANISLYGGNQGQGWGQDVTTGKPAFENNRYYGGRIKFLWTPTSRTSVLLAFDHDDTKSSEGYYRPVAGTVGAGFYPAPSGFYDLVDWTNPFWDTKQSGVSLNVAQGLGWARLRSITAYRYTTNYQLFDQSGGPFAIVEANLEAPDRTVTQELQLLSPDGSRISWIGGLFFLHDVSGYDPLGLSGLAVAPLLFGNIYSTQTTRSYAGYGQVTWPVLAKTHLTVGLRYTTDKRQMDAGYVLGVSSAESIPGVSPNSPQSGTWSQPSGRMSLDHQFTPDFMAYISYNRGFKSGMFNAVVTPGSPIGAPVKPETLDDYSIGEKAEFLDHRVRVNTEAFWYSYKNIQVTDIVPGGTALRNAAKATIKGLDLDTAWLPIDNLTVTADFEVLDGHYDNFPNGLYWIYSPNPALGVSNVNPAVAPNLAGNKTIDTPPFSSSLRIQYLYPMASGDLEFATSYTHGGDYFFDPDNGKGQITPALDKQPTLNLINASLTWTSPNGRYDIRAWGKNITGVKYYSFGFEEALLTQYSPAPPATYGVTFGVHFR